MNYKKICKKNYAIIVLKKEARLISNFYDNQQKLGFYNDTCLDNVREAIALAEKYQKNSSVEAWCNCFKDLTNFAVNIQ